MTLSELIEKLMAIQQELGVENDYVIDLDWIRLGVMQDDWVAYNKLGTTGSKLKVVDL